jgi:signal peptidase I
MPQPEAEAARPHRRAPWRDNLEALLMAVVMALFLKHFVVEAYRIPTGSMQPTLIGDEQAGIKDRILVDKLSYALRAPRRWEVAVFRYPLDRAKSFVKRIAGVGPEELKIENGDLWRRATGAEWTILRRPPEVMAEQWKRLDALDDEQSHWIPQNLPRSSRWSGTGRALSVRGSGAAAFRGGHESILDDYLDGYPEELLPWLPSHHRESAQNTVGDLRVEGRVTALAGTTLVAVVLREGARQYRFELPGPAAEAQAEARIDAGPSARGPATGEDGEGSVAHAPLRLTAGVPLRFAAQNLDDRLVLEVDGEELCALEIEPASDQFSSATLVLEGEGAELDELMVYRDVYYTARSSAPIGIPAGCYYMLGDNTQDSSDSREWTFMVLEVRGADGTSTTVRGNWRDGENPRSVAFGEADGPLTYLVDEWGERHWYPRDDARRRTPELAPFVPREMIQGKALAVFWPLDPLRGIFRLKWVH